MPPGTPYHSFLVEYPYIRVDEFTTIKEYQAKLHLLTHAHSDHIVGLQAKSFDQQIICSHDTKEIILRHEVYKERHLHEQEFRAEKKKTFSHLKVDPLIGEDGEVYYSGSKDLLKVVPLNTPYPVPIDDKRSVTVTLIDANHCPGSVMFLIEGSEGNVLHTGDIRAEPWYLESLKHNPFLKPYLATPGSTPGVLKTLDAIYLDTACVFNKDNVPSKEDATTGLIALMRLFPKTTHFFLNTWTLGYEDILTAVACAFGSKVHTDRYKHSLFTKFDQEPLLRSISTRDPSITRFHACERFDRCEYCDVPEHKPDSLSTKGNRVVYVNPVSTMNREMWKSYQTNTKNRLVAREDVTCLLVPLARHSPLPELQALVSMFRPKTIVPNTLDPTLDNLDWAAIHQVFSPFLSGKGGSAPSTQSSDLRALQDLSHDEDGIDVSLKNLVGDHADELAKKWVDGRGKRRKLEALKEWLGIIDPFPAPPMTAIRDDEDDRDGYGSSSDVDDEGERTMHKLFAPQVGIEVLESQPSSSPTRTPQLPSPFSSPARQSHQKRSLAVSPSSEERPLKRPRILRTPSPLPRSSPSAQTSSPLLTPRRSNTLPDLQRKGKARLNDSPTPQSKPKSRILSTRPVRASPLKASMSAPGSSRHVRTTQDSSDHDSDDDDERGVTADYIFAGIAPPVDASSDNIEPQDEVLVDVGNILHRSTPRPMETPRPSTAKLSTTPEKRTSPVLPLSVRLRNWKNDREKNSLRLKMIEQYNPHSPKYGELKRRDTKISMQIEWGQGRVALLEKKLKELEENAEQQPAMDEERVRKMTEDIRQARREGRRPVEVLPLLECTFGTAESQELSQLIEDCY